MEQNTRRFDACIFDLDGTLANTLTSIAHFGNATLGEFGLPESPWSSTSSWWATARICSCGGC